MLQIKDDKFFSKILSKESSTSNPSFRVYYGANSLGVPFVWEATPGTPKHSKQKLSHFLEEKSYDNIPPLTPPPSYYINQGKKIEHSSSSSSSRKSSSTRVFQGLFPKMMHRRQISTASSVSSSSTLSSISPTTLSSILTTSQSKSRVRNLSNTGSLFEFGVDNGHDDDDDDDDDEEIASPRSVMCFGIVGSRKIRNCTTAVVHN